MTRLTLCSLVCSTLIAALGGCALSSSETDDEGAEATSDELTNAPAVTFRVLTYNVAGLPEALSGSSPAKNTRKISPKLNPFDLVLVQEDFSYHDDLVSKATHPYETKPMSSRDLGDGLNALSRFPFASLERTEWKKCNGTFDQKNDCLASKGFSRFVLDVGAGRKVDVYNVHFDAGRSSGDVKAREAQVAQIVASIKESSAGRPVILAGDTNMRKTDEDTFEKLLDGASLDCACRTLGCKDVDRIDRVLFRSSTKVKLTPKTWANEKKAFLDGDGDPLSDHSPVSVTFEVR